MVTASNPTPLAAPLLPRADLWAGLLGAGAGTAGLVLLYREPLAATLFMLFLLCTLLFRWHTRADLLGLLLGLTAGNLTEYLCDLKGVWVHFNRDISDAAPLYIFVCYPILWLTVPRLMQSLMAHPRAASEANVKDALLAAFLWALHTALSFVVGTDNTLEGAVCIFLLGVCLWRFQTVHDRGYLGFGAALGLVWELPATVTGAWTFPHPTVLGLIPWWLPLAYAIFFGCLGRVLCFFRFCATGAA